MNRAKLKALVHYVIAKSDPSRLGATRLNKILWFSDAFAYRATGETITGESYIKRQHGPVPAHILGVVRELADEGAIVTRERQLLTYSMREFVSLRDPDTSMLSPQELELVDEVRGDICNQFTANSISELSHDRIWEAANMGEEIPMSATLISEAGQLTDEVLAWADCAIEKAESRRTQAA